MDIQTCTRSKAVEIHLLEHVGETEENWCRSTPQNDGLVLDWEHHLQSVERVLQGKSDLKTAAWSACSLTFPWYSHELLQVRFKVFRWSCMTFMQFGDMWTCANKPTQRTVCTFKIYIQWAFEQYITRFFDGHQPIEQEKLRVNWSTAK